MAMTAEGKYQPLQEYLQQQGQTTITLTISKIEQLIGDRLPASAHTQRAWWSNRRTGAVQATAWMAAGYYATEIDLAKETITFRKPPQIYQVERQGNIILWDAELVKALRHHMGLTQAEFAQELGIRQPTVSEWETGIYGPRRASSKLLTMVAEQVGFPYEAISDS
ncbi:MAG: helix-turn-helix transcriptional regulator [Caldilineaceae bacterium]